jgi:hypothetical protein
VVTRIASAKSTNGGSLGLQRPSLSTLFIMLPKPKAMLPYYFWFVAADSKLAATNRELFCDWSPGPQEGGR